MELSDCLITNNVIQIFLYDTSISSVCDFQAFLLQAVAYHHSQEKPLVFDINNAALKPHKPKKDKEWSISVFPEGVIYNMFTEQSTRSKVRITYNGDFLSNITLNMTRFHYSVSHIDHSTSGLSGDDDADDETLPRLIGHLKDDMMLIVMI